MSFLIAGSIAYDTVKTPYGSRTDVLGGSALYSALAASFFTPVNLVAVVGEDFKKEHIQLLKRKRIDTKGLKIKKGKTFRWEGKYFQNLNKRQTISTQLNVLENFKPKVPPEYKKSKYVFLANLDPNTQLEIIKQLKNTKLLASDTMNLWIDSKKDSLMKLLKYIQIFILNDSEAKQLTQQANLIKAAQEISKMGPKITIIKKGEYGALLFGKDFRFLSAAYPLESVCDPTGSGDVFAGGFIGYLAQKDRLSQSNFKKAVIYGSILASFNIESFSIKRLIGLTHKQIDKRYNELKKLTQF